MAKIHSLRIRPALLALALGVLIGTTGCAYNRHRNFGATEKWVGSDMNYVTKTTGTFFVSIGDAIISPFTMLWDQLAYSPEYSPDHHYFSYAGSRTIARSDMGLGYQWVAMFPTLAIETVWLVITGPVDLVTVLAFGDDGPADHDADDMGGGPAPRTPARAACTSSSWGS